MGDDQKKFCEFKGTIGISALLRSGTIRHASVRLCRKMAQSLGIFPDSIFPISQKILNGEWRILKQEAQRDEPKTEADYPAALQGSWESDNPRRAVQGMRFLH
jgi:hypothetical protein